MQANDANNLENALKILAVLGALFAFIENIQEHPLAAIIVCVVLALAILGHRYIRSPIAPWLGIGVLMAISVGCYVVPRITATAPPKSGADVPAGLPEVYIDEPDDNNLVSEHDVVMGHVKNGRLAVYLFQRHLAACEKGTMTVTPCIVQNGSWSEPMPFDGACDRADSASRRYEMHAIGVRPRSKLDQELEKWQSMKPLDYKNVVEAAPADAYTGSKKITVYRKIE